MARPTDKKYYTLPTHSSKNAMDKDRSISKEEGCIPSGTFEEVTDRDSSQSAEDERFAEPEKRNERPNRSNVESLDFERNTLADKMATDNRYYTLPIQSSKNAMDKDHSISKEEGCIPSGTFEGIPDRDLPRSAEDEMFAEPEKRNERPNKRNVVSLDCEKNTLAGKSAKSNPLRWTTGSANITDSVITHDLFLIYVADNLCKEIQLLLKELRTSKELNYLDFENDFLPNESLFNIIGSCIMRSKRTLLMLSPLFYSSNFHMYFLEMAVAHCADHGNNGIISLLVNTTESEKPTSLFPFVCFDSQKGDWLRDIIHEAKKEVKPLASDICLNDNHFNLDNFSTIRSVYSEPATLKFQAIPELMKQRLKIWRIMREKNSFLPKEWCSKPSLKKPPERTVDSNMDFAIKLRRDGKKVYECSRTFFKDSLKLAAGDVVEIISVSKKDPKCVEIRDCEGYMGEIPINYLTPSIFPIPSSMVKLFDLAISKENNDEFKQAIEELGQPVFIATVSVSGNAMKLPVNENDILYMISDTGNKYLMKNYQNKVGYVNKSLVKKLESGNDFNNV